MKTVDVALAFAERVYSRVSDAGIIAAEVRRLREENERQRFDILAMNQSLDLMREENERQRKDADRLEWLLSDFGTHCFSVDHAWDGESDLRVVIDKVRGAK